MTNGIEIMKTSLLFSGQGSQYVCMLKDIYEKYPTAKAQINKADEVVGFELSKICFEGPIEILKETKNTQPAIFLHSAVVFDLVKDKLKFDAVAGHSVGEYAALYGANVLSFENALKLVSVRGKLMFEAGLKLPGTMFAVINLDDDKLENVCNELNQNSDGNVVVPANFNSPGQVVISGSADFLRANVSAFKNAGARMVKELVVSGAFHSPLMEPAKLELEKAINETEFNDAIVPLYSNVLARPIIKAEEIKSALIAQLTSPVRWTQSLIAMKNDGISKFIEIGPGNVLQGLTKRTLENVEIFGIDKSEDIENYL